MLPFKGIRTSRDSPDAVLELLEAIDEGMSPVSDRADDLMGATDCPSGCVVEADGICFHGYKSAALSAGLI